MGLAVIVEVIPMASNGKPQFLRHVFSQQSNGAVTEKVQRFGGQDKTALPRGHAATPQPEPHAIAARSHLLDTKTTRTKKHGSSKRKTVHLVLWVNPIVKAELKRIADQEGLSLSKAGGELLSRALQQNIDMQYNAFLTPVIEAAIKKEIRSFSNRIAMLLARTLFASEQTRSLTTNILGRQPGITEDLLKHILSMSQKAAKSNLSRKTSPELIAAIEQWLLYPDEEEKPNN
jgi:hypothetical protein